MHQGPTDTSNWLVPGRILMSAYPGDITKTKARLKAVQLIEAGITTFVCLQEKEELVRFSAYDVDLRSAFTNTGRTGELEFINFEIPDNDIASDRHVDNFTDELVTKFHKGN